MTNAQKIKDARKSLGMSQSKFAEALGLSRKQTISDWEQGKKEPKAYVWLAIQSLTNARVFHYRSCKQKPCTCESIRGAAAKAV